MFSTKDRQQRSSFTDNLIFGRNTLLDRLSGAGPDLVLNPQVDSSIPPPPADLAARLKETVDDLKAAAMDQEGASIDYESIRHNPVYKDYRQNCLAKLHRFQPLDLPGQAAQRAFWINLYNALVLDAVIAFDIHDSVTKGWLGILAFFRRAAYIIEGQRVSLEDIEHGILRGNRGNPYVPGPHFALADPRHAWSLPLDPRIHFALNCGGVSCPPIRSYAPGKLDTQLALAARSFIASTVRIYPESEEIHVSQILRWYQADFGSREQLLDFLIAHLPDETRRSSLAGSLSTYRLVYTPYDWHLNNS